MRVQSFRLRGIRCFSDTGDVQLSPTCNIFVGQNNAGKSTLLRGLTGWQINPLMTPDDVRPGFETPSVSIVLEDVKSTDFVADRNPQLGIFRYIYTLYGSGSMAGNGDDGLYFHQRQAGTATNVVFRSDWPNNFIVPFSAKRKAVGFAENISSGIQSGVDGTFTNLYARIDRVVAPGPQAHDFYRHAVQNILGVFITTQASPNGKRAGYYYDESNFVTLDRMGDGVTEIVALIVDLSLARGKLFVLEEPETNLHPSGLKALLNLIRESSKCNQFVIATHSNIVVRELAEAGTSLYRVGRVGDMPDSPSEVRAVEKTPAAHANVLRELGYEFGDFDLYDGWLFLEEASAETIIREFLIPWFAPKLKEKLRTFSAGGVGNLEPTIFEFQRLITFIHLEPVYQNRIWVRADGDESGRKTIDNLRSKFSYLASPRTDVFREANFEAYYPPAFAERVKNTLNISDKQNKRAAKAELLRYVVEWTRTREEEAKAAWAVSAAEQIEMLTMIQADLLGS